MPRLRFVLAALATLAIGSSLATGCSNQGEGERCDHLADNSGNDDCQDGLQCTLATDLNSHTDLCCPPDRRTATTPQCALNQGGFDASPAPPDSAADAPAVDTGTGGGDGASDAPAVESGSDASDAAGG
jgi:hypothetical protein